MADYSTCIHEGSHAVAGSLLDVEWLAVTVRAQHDGSGALGRIIHDGKTAGWLLQNVEDPEANWRASAFGIVCLAGPLAQAKWQTGDGQIDLEGVLDFGGGADLGGAEAVSETYGMTVQNLLNHAVEFVDTDRVWLAIQRVADALVDTPTLVSTDVERLIGKKAKGAGQW
jgi:hypothetical protein